MVVAKIVRETGIYLIPKVFKAFQRYDVKVFRGLYGKSAGRGVRHGRDIGAAVGSSLSLGSSGDDLDRHAVPQEEYGHPSGTKSQTYRRRNYNNNRYSKNRCPPGRGRRRPRS